MRNQIFIIKVLRTVSFDHSIGQDYMLTILDNNEVNLPIKQGSTFDTYHTYEIDWKPDQITWSIDGNVMRTLEKSKTFNTTTNTYHFPQTPARVQLSLWPAGSSKNGKGTIEWAGGLVDWNSQDVQTNGYYYALFKDVNVECYDPPPGANVTGSKAYIYTSLAGTNASIAETNDKTILKSLLGTGTDMDKDYPKPATASDTSSVPGTSASSAAAAAATSEVATVPGLTGAGPGTNGQRPDDSGTSGNSGSGSGSGSGSDSGSGSGSGSDSGSGSTDTSSAAGSASTGFVQGDKSTSNSNSAPQKGEKAIQGSMFAILVAFLGMLLL